MFPFGKGRPRKSRPLVETTPRVAQPPSTGVAREEVRVVIEGAPQTLEIVRQARIYGQEAFWICPKCASTRLYLFVLNGEIGCRGRGCLWPSGLSYASRHTRNRAALRARKLRRKLGRLDAFVPLRPQR